MQKSNERIWALYVPDDGHWFDGIKATSERKALMIARRMWRKAFGKNARLPAGSGMCDMGDVK